MPLYEYKCKKCGHRFELIQSFSAPDAKECPVCQGEVERLISTPARAHFKGSGFYSTDYGAKPPASGTTPAPSEGGSSKPSETKAAPAKTESTSSPAPSSPSSKSE
jgi:putative FmdB family regulatory protein